MDYEARAREIIRTEIAGLERVADAVGPAFTGAVKLILERLAGGGKVVCTGVGKNLHIAEKISATLASTGSTSVVLHPAQAVHGDLGVLGGKDVMLALSYSGASDELLAIVPVVRRLRVPIIAMTGDTGSPLAEVSTIVLPVTVDGEACLFNMAPTASTTATLALGDALALVLAEARGFKREDYALLHPAGAIGRALVMRVGDIMRTGRRVASVSAEALVRTALLAMTDARAGSVAVVDEAGCLLGIFTDGDLRRRIALQTDLLTLPVRDVMTPSPVTVHPDQLAVDVLNIFEARNIDDVIVVDDANRVVGAVDIQDLPKFKIL